MRAEGKSAPRCPFCGAELPRPTEIRISDIETGPGGSCSCGAFFLVDATGKNAGLLMAQALGRAADILGKGVGELTPDEDYQEAILNYDWRTHRSTGPSHGFLDGAGRLYIMKVRAGAK